jgi:aspartate carbamoyltransferase regulatory subunit
LNVPSNKYEKKDIIKVENRYLEPDETNKLSLIAPHATINIIKDYKLAEKRKIQLPDYITGIFKCPNLRCVTIGENIKSVIEVIDKEKIILKCKYCGRILSIDELITNTNEKLVRLISVNFVFENQRNTHLYLLLILQNEIRLEVKRPKY